jgi:2,3-bisphosphoglycerate-dependent phosphoglycerate mutase
VPIYLIRHGESQGNAQRRYQGRQDTALTAQGEDQARALGRFFAHRGIACDAVFCSPLKRAARTAELIAETAGLSAPLIEPLLQEYHVGELEGLGLDEIEARWPGFSSRPLVSRGDFSEFGGESYEQMQERLQRFIAVQRERFTPEQHVLAVSHGGCLYQLLKLWCGWPAPRHYFTRIANCTCFKLSRLELNGHHTAQLEWMLPLELTTLPEAYSTP